jgi:adenosylcobyric acid synthase
MLSRISNFDDFDPLKLEPSVRLVMVPPGRAIPGDAALVILPGSKATIADLSFLRAQGWDVDLKAHHRRGGMILGICGGYQMLGRSIADPAGVEGPPGMVEGLGYLDVETVLTGEKSLVQVLGHDCRWRAPLSGYEMHVGRTTGPGAAHPLLRLTSGRDEGAISADGRVAGCYVHGLFAETAQRAAWLARLGAVSAGIDYHADVDAALDELAAALAEHLDLKVIGRIAGLAA